MPGPLGLAPTRIAISTPVNASYKFVVPFNSLNKGNAQSLNSINVPSSWSLAAGTSKRVKDIN